ncbi:hypothetical protein L0222_15860 [bacterium]|nr:hypothetical protein [bacterium]MCI0603123.1 hypothetical protein [bacterium]
MKKTPIVAILVVTVFFVVSSAGADHPTRDFRSLVPLAHELELVARHVHKEGERQAHHGNRREAYALNRLHRLNESAAHFHDEVERYSRNPRHTESDFRVLVNTYYEARYAMRGLHAFDHLYDDFDQVTRLMRRLVNVYSGYGNYFPRNHRGYGSNHGYDSRYEDEYDQDEYDYEEDESDHDHDDDDDDNDD